MYWLTPFHYLLEGMLALLTDGIPIRCATNELAVFPPPPGQSCQSYAGGYAQQAGGYVETQPNGDCGFCQYRSGTEFAASFNVYARNIWRDFGIMCKCRASASIYLFAYYCAISDWLIQGSMSFSTLQSSSHAPGCIWAVRGKSNPSSVPRIGRLLGI